MFLHLVRPSRCENKVINPPPQPAYSLTLSCEVNRGHCSPAESEEERARAVGLRERILDGRVSWGWNSPAPTSSKPAPRTAGGCQLENRGSPAQIRRKPGRDAARGGNGFTLMLADTICSLCRLKAGDGQGAGEGGGEEREREETKGEAGWQRCGRISFGLSRDREGVWGGGGGGWRETVVMF